MTTTEELDFFALGLSMGSEIEADATGEIATVVARGRVLFRGRELSLAEASCLVGNVDRVVEPTIYWNYRGVCLVSRYRRVYGDDC